LRLFSFGGYGLARAALALVVFGAYDSYPSVTILIPGRLELFDPSITFFFRKNIQNRFPEVRPE